MARPSLASPPLHAPALHQTASPIGPNQRLAIAAGLIAVVFGLVLVAPMPVWSGHPPGPPEPGSVPTSADLGVLGLLLPIGFALVLCLPFRPYAWALRPAQAAPARVVLGLTAMLALVALLIYPHFGSDIFDYVGFERLWVVYRDNPLVATPSGHPSDWSYPFVWFPDRPPAYGPVWVLLTWPIAWLAGDDPTGYVLGYKAVVLVAYLVSCWLIWANSEATRRKRALVMYAWSPLVLFDVLGKVHNDVLTGLTMLAAVVLASRSRAVPGLLAGVAGALIKLTGLAVAPVLVAHQVRLRRWKAVCVGLGVACLVCTLLYLPFWAGPETLRPVLWQTGRFIWSPATLLLAATDALPGGSHESAVRLTLAVVWAAGCVLVLRRGRLLTASELAASSCWLLLLTLLLLTTAFFAHYLVPVIALAALAGDRHLDRIVVALSVGALAAYAVELIGLAAEPGWIGSRGYQVFGSLVLLVPAVIAVGAARLHAQRPRMNNYG